MDLDHSNIVRRPELVLIHPIGFLRIADDGIYLGRVRGRQRGDVDVLAAEIVDDVQWIYHVLQGIIRRFDEGSIDELESFLVEDRQQSLHRISIREDAAVPDASHNVNVRSLCGRHRRTYFGLSNVSERLPVRKGVVEIPAGGLVEIDLSEEAVRFAVFDGALHKIILALVVFDDSCIVVDTGKKGSIIRMDVLHATRVKVTGTGSALEAALNAFGIYRES
mmetsp:Transcript_25274/g.59160  ORF Transcript_25274/g.59160 Transcript_25274/m.59160 type:complete len:221 (-) Transcript_25274:198-860(-)